MEQIDFKAFVPKFDKILKRGLSNGLGVRSGQMCIEAAVCAALDLPHGDDPPCVARAVRSFKINLNDSNWSSPKARAEGMRALGIAQVGSAGVVDDVAFATRLAELTIRHLVPKLFRELFAGNETLMAAALRCEKEGTNDAAKAASNAASAAAWAAWAAARAASDAAWAASAASDAAWAARAARAAAWAASNPDSYLKLSANLALQVLTELKSPGVEFIG